MRTILKILISATTLSTLSSVALAGTVNIYSNRQPDLIQPLLEEFTKQTGIEAKVQFFKQGMVEKLQAEGVNSPADVILTIDIGRLTEVAEKGLTQKVSNEKINSNIPKSFRSEDGSWFGLTMRGRVIFASKDRVDQNELTYEDLAKPEWKGRICTRSGQHEYNVALFASMIANKGDEFTEKWLSDVKNNLARKPDGNDRAQAKAIFAGECDIGIGNTYYVGLMQNNEKEPEQKEWANSIKVIFPNTNDRGTHINVSGMALAKHAPNKDTAIQFMEFLASDIAQEIYAEKVFEYPVKPGAKISATVASFGEIKPDSLSLDTIAKYRKAASQLVDKVGYDNGPQS